MNNTPTDDEALANQLQDQYRREFLERQRTRNTRSRDAQAQPSAPSLGGDVEVRIAPTSNVGPPAQAYILPPSSEQQPLTDDEALARRLQEELDQEAAIISGNVPITTATSLSPADVNDGFNSASPMDGDARIAQQLQDEELARRYDVMEQRQISQGSSSFVFRQPSNFMDERSSMTDDELQARRIAQEMNDADMAARLSMYEQEAAQRRRLVAENAAAQRQNENKNCVRHFLPMLLCGVILAVALLFLLGVFESEDIPILGDIDPQDIFDNDPFSGQGTIDGEPPEADGVYRWDVSKMSNGQGGLQLEVVNAMEDSWTKILQQAVISWDNGYPVDSLTLFITTEDYDFACKAIQGKLKVCNGDYGNTRWRGLNEVALSRRDNIIISSSAKMNEYYLNHDSSDQLLYTMCHELGHGFGLPHWDEDFFNPDMGNCMDYTRNPSVNKQPDESNFNFLAELYGGRNITAVAEGLPANSGGRTRNLSSSSPFKSKLTGADHPDHHPGRRVLYTDDKFELHWQESSDDKNMVHLYHYLIVGPDE